MVTQPQPQNNQSELNTNLNFLIFHYTLVLKHMRYDKTSGHFMPIESRRKQNHMMVRYKVDEANHRVLQEMLNKAEGVRIGFYLGLPRIRGWTRNLQLTRWQVWSVEGGS